MANAATAPASAKPEPNVRDTCIRLFFEGARLQRMFACFSKMTQAGSQAHQKLTDIVTKLLKEQIFFVLGPHGIYFFADNFLVYPYSSLDDEQREFVRSFIRVDKKHTRLRIAKQMGGAHTVRVMQLSNLHPDPTAVLLAVVHGIFANIPNYSPSQCKHAANLQLQRIYTRVQVSRAAMQKVNDEIEQCVLRGANL